jgi:hypothetical protein
MPKLFKWILSGFFLVAVGIVMIIIGMSNNGRNSLLWRDGWFEVPEAATVARNLDAFDNITIKTSSVPVTIEEGTNFSISGSVNDKKALQIDNAKKNLTVSYKLGAQSVGSVGVGFGGNRKERLVITVPKGTDLSKITIDGTDGDVALSNISVKTTNVKTNWSDVSFKNVKLTSLTANVQNADFSASNVTAETSGVKVADGRVAIANSDFGRAVITLTDSTTSFDEVKLDKAIVQLSDTKATFTNTAWADSNTVTLKDGAFTTSANTVDGYQLQVSNGKLTVHGDQYTGGYNENDTATNRLNVIANDADVTVK